MSTFVKGGSTGTPFGRNEFLRSVRNVKTESYTCIGSTNPSRTIDGVAGQKILQPGTIMAKLTTGGVGPYSSDTVGVTDGRSALANIVGINMTFLPWQLIERDVEISVVYEASVVAAWCLMYTLASPTVPVAVTNAVQLAMQKQGAGNTGNIGLDITWR